MIYLTFVGNKDTLDTLKNGYGAVITIFLQYRDEIESVYIFETCSPMKTSVDYHKIAEQNMAFILSEKPEANVHLIPIELPNPIDFDIVYPVLLDATQKVLDNEDINSQKKIINITSGTPTMTTCWVLLHKSGLIPNSILIQSFEEKYANERGQSTQIVDLEIDDFPQITAPNEIKRQLTLFKRENVRLTEQLNASELDSKIPGLMGHSHQIRQIKDIILHDIDNKTHVLILGERGTGKQEVAEAIWQKTYPDKELVTSNCGAINENLIISELFGHKKGAFTGANQDKTGVVQKSDGGLLFLDEIGNLPMQGQNALLRLLQFGEVQQIGAESVSKVEVQIIAATNKDINDQKIFAPDLKDRFHETITLPPLRERREDIPLLANHFLRIFSKERDLSSPLVLKSDVMKKLQEYNWPGNVRDLMNWIRKATKRFDGGEITLNKLPQRVIDDIMLEEDDYDLPDLPLSISINNYTEQIREKARQQAGGNMAESDRLLGQNKGAEKMRQYRKRKKYVLENQKDINRYKK